MTNVEFKVTASPKRLHTVANLSLLLKNDKDSLLSNRDVTPRKIHLLLFLV